MNYRIEQHEALAMTGLSIRTRNVNEFNTREIPAFWQKLDKDGTLAALLKKIPEQSKMGLMGVCMMDDYDEKTHEFTYLVAIETPADRSGLPAGCVDVKAPSATWAIFESKGPVPTAIQEVWKRIFQEWFPTSGYDHANGPELELYSQGDCNAADYHSEVWIPVRKASEK